MAESTVSDSFFCGEFFFLAILLSEEWLKTSCTGKRKKKQNKSGFNSSEVDPETNKMLCVLYKHRQSFQENKNHYLDMSKKNAILQFFFLFWKWKNTSST